MQDKFENLIRSIYRGWKRDQSQVSKEHPDEETLACFLEDKLSAAESDELKMHLIRCDSCLKALSLQLSLEPSEAKEIPKELLERVKGLAAQEDKSRWLEILLKVKEKAFEIINTTGDVLVGQEFLPAPVLRSRSLKDFKDEVTILKEFKDIRIEIKVENKESGVFNLIISAKQKQTQKIIKDLRVTLFKEDLELESYLTDFGSVTFEHILLGRYKLEVSNIEEKVASVLLDIKV